MSEIRSWTAADPNSSCFHWKLWKTNLRNFILSRVYFFFGFCCRPSVAWQLRNLFKNGELRNRRWLLRFLKLETSLYFTLKNRPIVKNYLQNFFSFVFRRCWQFFVEQWKGLKSFNKSKCSIVYCIVFWKKKKWLFENSINVCLYQLKERFATTKRL